MKQVSQTADGRTSQSQGPHRIWMIDVNEHEQVADHRRKLIHTYSGLCNFRVFLNLTIKRFA